MKKKYSDPIVSYIITFFLCFLTYFMMSFIKLPQYEIPIVNMDQIIDTNIIIAQIDEMKTELESRYTSEERKTPDKPKTQPLNEKIEIKDILKENPKLSKRTRISENRREKMSREYREKKTSLNLKPSTSKSPLQRGLDFLNKKTYSTTGTEMPWGKKNPFGEENSLAIDEREGGSGTDSSNTDFSTGDGLGLPGGPRGNDSIGVFIGYIPKKKDIPRELRKVIQWIVDHHIELTLPINNFLHKAYGDYTSKVRFRIKDIKYEMFLRATPTRGNEEIAFAICYGDSVALVIDQTANREDDKLQIGSPVRKNSEVIGFKSALKSFNYDISGRYSQIFWAWWESEKSKETK